MISQYEAHKLALSDDNVAKERFFNYVEKQIMSAAKDGKFSVEIAHDILKNYSQSLIDTLQSSGFMCSVKNRTILIIEW